eukprot:scaffold25693_cov229-Skeletonema_marinoi.AAC.6
MIFNRSFLASTRRRPWTSLDISIKRRLSSSSSATEATSILFLSPTSWPEPNATAAGIRTVSLLNHFATRFDSVHFGCGAPMKESMTRFANNVHWHHIKPNRTDDMTNLLQHIQHTHGTIRAVVFDRFYAEEAYSFRIREQCPNALRILDMQDVHSLRIGRQQLVKEIDQRENSTNNMATQLIDEVMKFDPSTHEWAQDLPQAQKAHNTLLRELASIHRSDLVLVCSSSEMNMLKQPSWNIAPWKLVSAPFFQKSVEQDMTTSYDERSDFVSIGGFKHPPNVDSVRLLRRIWPRIRSHLPDAKLHVYGAYPTNEIGSMHDEKLGFYVHGIKGKIVDSWGYGLPVVTTSVGAEGMMTTDAIASDDWGGLIVSNEDEFVEAAVNLYTTKELWEYSQNRAIVLLNSLFNKEQNLQVIDEALSDAMMNLGQRRKRDITSQLLWHQSNRSTEYFSKWIELKEVK